VLLISLSSCSDSASEARIRELEARIERQEIANEQLRRRLSGMLDGLALRMDRVVDALGDGAAKPSAPIADVTPMPSTDRGDKATAERVVASPANPADALARDRRTGAWIAALCAVVAAAFVGWRWHSQRARGWRGDAEGEASADSAAWDEANVLSDAVPQKELNARAASTRSDQGIGEQDVIILDPMDADEPAALGVEPTGTSTGSKPHASQHAESKAEARIPPSTDSNSPARTAFHVDAKEPAVARASIESYLRHDPRVLQKPAPAVRSHEGGISVECALLPGLAAGEREHLRAVLQRLASTR
jgi:uncharacterized coiled-coil protein SlyX